VPGKNLPVGDVEIDDGVSLVDTWKGKSITGSVLQRGEASLRVT
jgi:hypothetical protein